MPITVAAGGTLSFSVNFTPAVMGVTTGEITIVSDGVANDTLVVRLSGIGTAATTPGPPELSSFSCVDATVTGPAIDSCTVELSAAATSGGFAVSLTSDNASVSLPASVTIAEGSTAASFTANVSAVSATETATLTASAGGVAEAFALQVNAASQVGTGTAELSGLHCGRSSVTGAGTDNCTVTLNVPAASAGFAVGLASNNSSVTVPASVTVAAGATTGSFTATATAVSTAQTATLTASAGGVAETFALQLNASSQGGTSSPVLSGLSCNSSSMTSAGSDSCTVTLNAAAANGGFAVSLSSNNSAVTVPASVTVAAGATTGGFTATVITVSTTQTATLTASAGGVAQTFALQLGAGGPTLSINATSVAFGNVNLNTPSTQSVTLSSTGTAAVTVSAAAVSGNGFTISGATVPLTLSSSQSATINVQFDPTVAGTAIGTLTIVSTSLTNPTAIIALSGTGVAASYQVNLTWDPPTSSPVPVAGYNVYRALSGNSSYTQLNSTVITQTTYADTNVQNGLTYDYIVESIDASGVQSVPSNTAIVPVP